MKKLSFALFTALLVSCGTNELASEPGSDEPSSSSIGKTYLTIKNNSGIDLESVKWNNTDFGNISKASSVKKEVEPGRDRVNFVIPNERAARILYVNTQGSVSVEAGVDEEFKLLGNTRVEETANPLNYADLIKLEKQNVEEVEITVYLNGGSLGGKFGEGPFEFTADLGGNLREIGIPTKSGYMLFDGWYTEADGGTKKTTIERDMTLYAHWATYTSKIPGSWKNDEEKEKLNFSEGITVNKGWNEWVDEDGDTCGFDFNWIATNEKIEITLTKVYIKYSSGGKFESEDPDYLELDPEYSLPYSFSPDGNTLIIQSWMEYTRYQ